MDGIVLTAHALHMVRERRIDLAWVVRALSGPDCLERKDDGALHYLKVIPERDGRVLRVVLHPEAGPRKVVTLFFEGRSLQPHEALR